MVFWLLKKSKNHKYIIMREVESHIVIIAITLGLFFTHVQANQAVGQTNNSNSSDGAGSAKAQASASLPSVSLGDSNSGGKPSGSPEPSLGLDGVNWDGKSFKITDIKIIDSKFSAYLNEPEISYEEEKEYAKLVNELLERLDIFRIRSEGKRLLQEVLPILKAASRHPRDGGLCRQIYNAVGVDAQSKDTALSKEGRINALKKEIDTIKWNMSVTAKPSAMDTKPNMNSTASSFEYEEAQREKRTRMAFMQNELEDKYSELLATQNSIASKTDDARLALQRMVIGNFINKRFDHVMIAASFYRLLYSDGAGEVKLQERIIEEAANNAKKLRSATSFDKNTTTSETMGIGTSGLYSNKTTTRNNSESGITSMLPSASEALGAVTAAKIKVASLIPDTMTEVEMISQEAIDQCNRYVSAVRGHIAQNELENAFERLQEAFAVGEQLASIRSFPREYRQQLWKYKKAVKEARAGLASKDLGKAKLAMDQLGQMTTDNPFSKEESEMGNIKTISAMHLAKAKEAATRGDRETMNKELEEAAKIWPQNPALAEASAKMLDQLNQQVQGKEELKKLLEQKNFKYIMEEKAKFLAVASDDPALLEKLKNVLEQEGKALSWKARVEELLKRNDPYGAWEEAEKGIIEHPESNDLMKLRSDAAVKCPEFVDKIEKARIATVRQDPAAALAAYLVARQIYPQSALAREGIDSLSKQLLSK
jgi:hypothetical protein